MNFDYIKEAEPSTDDLRQLYDSLYQNLEKAEELYWTKPQRCGMMLRKATEKICRIYNGYYEINFPESATLEEYLCYTGDDDHNAMVSRFLSVVRKEQRDRLEWLRVWGDECVFMEENPDQIRHNADKLYLNVKKMMVYMMEATKAIGDGVSVGIYRDNEKKVPVLLKSDMSREMNLDQLGDLAVWNGIHSAPLAQVTKDIRIGWEYPLIRTYNRQLSMAAMCDVQPGHTMAEVHAEIKNEIEKIQLPEGYTFFWDAQD